MKKIVISLGIIISIVWIGIGKVSAIENTFQLELEVVNNTKEESYTMYLLLPEEYIQYVIQIEESNIEIENDLGNMFTKYDIPSIPIEKQNLQPDYKEGSKKYLQVKIEKNEQGKYSFPILTTYGEIDMKFRIKSESKDYIIHMDNFKIEDGKCEAIYQYDEDTIKQPDRKILPFGVILLFIILGIVIVVGIIAYYKQKNK